MSLKLKSHSFLLLEILVSLLLLSLCTPVLLKSLGALVSSQQSWKEEKNLQQWVDEYFIQKKLTLDYDVLEKSFKENEEDPIREASTFQFERKEIPITLQIVLLDQKKGALLLELTLSFSNSSSLKSRHFSQTYCLKKIESRI